MTRLINGDIWTTIFSYLPPQDFSKHFLLNSETCRLNWRVLLDVHFPNIDNITSRRSDTMELSMFNANDLAMEDYIYCYSLHVILDQLNTKQAALVREAGKCAYHTGERLGHYMNNIFSWSCCGRYEYEGLFASATDMNTIGCVVYPKQANYLETLQKQHSEIQERVRKLPDPFVKCLKCHGGDHRTRDCQYLHSTV